MKKPILVTGAAGFIGYHLSDRLTRLGYTVVGLDNLNDYYEVSLKEARLQQLSGHPNFQFHKMDLCDADGISGLFQTYQFEEVIHLAAQAGVRYSLTNPGAYLKSNLEGYLNILESCRHFKVKHLIYASSSSVYGANRVMPFSVHQNVDHPISLYAASKKSNELMAHCYSSLFDIPTTGLRFFTVYGPYGRPDMAIFLFTKAILENRPIDVFNNGMMKRDFTYVDDIIESIVRLIPLAPSRDKNWNALDPDPGTSFAPWKVFNIGNNQPVELLRFIEILEEKLGRKAIKNFLPLQDGDVLETFADVEDLAQLTGFRPKTSPEEGIGRFVNWYKQYYKI